MAKKEAKAGAGHHHRYVSSGNQVKTEGRKIGLG